MQTISENFLDRLYQDLEDGKLPLPSLPDGVLQVREVLENPDSSLTQATRVIARNAELGARLIQVANGGVLRASRPVDTVEHALVRLGHNLVLSLVIGMALEQLFQSSDRLVDHRLRRLWQHSLEVGTLAHALAGSTRLRADRALLAGLLHDVGVLPILQRALEQPALLHDEHALNDVLARAHPLLGAAIVRKWELADEIEHAVCEHENLDYEGAALPDYADLVIVANLQGERRGRRGDFVTPPAFGKLGLENGRGIPVEGLLSLA